MVAAGGLPSPGVDMGPLVLLALLPHLRWEQIPLSPESGGAETGWLPTAPPTDLSSYETSRGHYSSVLPRVPSASVRLKERNRRSFSLPVPKGNMSPPPLQRLVARTGGLGAAGQMEAGSGNGSVEDPCPRLGGCGLVAGTGPMLLHLHYLRERGSSVAIRKDPGPTPSGYIQVGLLF